MTNYASWGLCYAMVTSHHVRVVGRCLYKTLGSDQEIGSSRNHLSTCLYFKILQYDYTLLSLPTLLLYESLRSKNPETIVIVSTGRSNIELL